MPNSTALHMITVYCFGYITLALASVLTNCKINIAKATLFHGRPYAGVVSLSEH
jgi:hypothetical protein